MREKYKAARSFSEHCPPPYSPNICADTAAAHSEKGDDRGKRGFCLKCNKGRFHMHITSYKVATLLRNLLWKINLN